MTFLKQITLADLLVLIGAGLLIVSLSMINPIYGPISLGIILMMLGLPGVYGR